MSRYPRLMPTAPRLFTATVRRSTRLSPSFQRVTITDPSLTDFPWLGRDQWFRLFLPASTGQPLQLPRVNGRAWYRSYLGIPEPERPHCSNYTVAGYRRGPESAELDIDVVLHGHGDELGGTVARWAVGAEPGSPLGLLDQGGIFDPPDDTEHLLLACDETGLPGVCGILRDLPRDAVGQAHLEVPTSADIRDLPLPPGLQVEWLPRDDASCQPGTLALAAVHAARLPALSYAYLVGESTLATSGRRALKKVGLPVSRISFTGYWKA